MAACCFSLIGLPLTVGFFGKLYLIRPALHSQLYGLVVLTMINAAISAYRTTAQRIASPSGGKPNVSRFPNAS